MMTGAFTRRPSRCCRPPVRRPLSPQGDVKDKAPDAAAEEAIKVGPARQPILNPGYCLQATRLSPIQPPLCTSRANPGEALSYVQSSFDDSTWQPVTLPHDWAIAGPFTRSGGGGMGRLPSGGVGWYRSKKITIPASDAGKCFFLDVDGPMSYAAVWNQRQARRWMALRLRLVAHRSHLFHRSRKDKSTGDPNRQSRRVFTLVSRRGPLSKRLAHEDEACACRTMGNYVTTTDVSATSATVHLASPPGQCRQRRLPRFASLPRSTS